ncbi:MAG: hypothetical protein EAZ89_07005, partial [Bacteroidetes bacterium]
MILLLCPALKAQPVLSSRQILSGFLIYRDFKDKNVFYFAPGDLKLALSPEGKPEFQLLQMRYTGSSSYGDAGDKHFRNLVQLTVVMEAMTVAQATSIRQALAPGANITLRPMPIRRIESSLVTPIGKDSEVRYERIGSGGAFEAVSATSESNRSAYWTQRTFSLKLDAHEAQILWEQIEKGQLALSLNYAFYADALVGNQGEIMISGTKPLPGNLLPETPQLDTAVQVYAVKSNALSILIDPVKWPELLRKIDINEDAPPAYAALEVKCYDFSDDLRPDLFRKSMEIRATGVSGQPVSVRVDFSKATPDLYSRSIRFPYAVKMTQPLQYRVEEVDIEGNKTSQNWVIQASWSDLLDITTPETNNAFEKRTLEFEIDTEAFTQAGIPSLVLEVRYVYR